MTASVVNASSTWGNPGDTAALVAGAALGVFRG